MTLLLKAKWILIQTLGIAIIWLKGATIFCQLSQGPMNPSGIVSNSCSFDTYYANTYSSISNVILSDDFYADREDNNNYISLYWSTMSEENNENFVIERSKNGIDFVEIANLPGAKNSSSVKSYFYLDQDAPEGILYYRLKQKDINGEEELLKTISISKIEEPFLINEIFIDKTDLVIIVESQIFSLLDIKIHSLTGDLTFSNINQIIKGSNRIKIPFAHLNKGVYIVSLQRKNGFIIRKKIII